jgi:hypothetical protein
MTRTGAIAIITATFQSTLETADDATLAAAAAHLAQTAVPSSVTVGEVLAMFQSAPACERTTPARVRCAHTKPQARSLLAGSPQVAPCP